MMTPSRLAFSSLILVLYIFTTEASPPETVSAAPPEASIRAQQAKEPAKEPAKADEADQILVDLVSGTAGLNEKTFTRGQYKHVRAAFTKYFVARQGPAIKLALGEDAEPLFAWLDKNPEIKEVLFTAIDPAWEEPAKVMRVFHDLWKADPEAVKKSDELAIAISVVWDDPRGVYDYGGHQRRTKSLMPDTVKTFSAMDNFKYVLERQAKLKGPQLQLPWEFLIHVVNHRTPTDERDWAATNYLKKRSGIGAIYKEIVYDTEMLRTQSRVCKLNDKPYTLPSIRANGGVCAMQADFAARVAKSVMVPAEYVGGEGNSGVLHAWVMWVEVKAVNKDAVTFTPESFGRYNIDNYYIGTLRDPQTGKDTTDRELERRLTAVGNAPYSSRHADLLMRAYPIVRNIKNYTTKQQHAYLNKVLAVYPMCGEAWVELAALHRDAKLTDAQEATRLVDRAVLTFAKFPDFSWKVVPDLLTAQKDKQYRTRTYERLATAYENLGRLDLACEARLKLVEYQVEAKEHQKAFKGLAFTVRKFPDEGRYVPKMIDKMQEVAKEIKGGDTQMVAFWLEILPKVPPTRGSDVSDYCVKIHQKALTYLKDINKTKEAGLVEQNLARIQKGKSK